MKALIWRDLQLPGIGSMSGISGKRVKDLAFYSFTSFYLSFNRL
ncbi:MAG: hypothetical protein R2759_07265 [Bacteroidales bacterium]